MNLNKIMASLSFGAAVLLAGCQSDGVHDFENKVFMLEESFVRNMYVSVDEKTEELSAEISVGMADFEDYDVEVQFAAAPELLDTYRLAYYDEDAVLLPQGHYDLGEMKAVIAAGNVSSAPVSVLFKDLMDLDYTLDYVLPVSIVSASGLDVLESTRTIYFLIKDASLINIVGDIGGNCLWPEWGDFDEVADMETFTFEALVKANSFDNESRVHTIMGIEDVFLVRVGDVTIDKNQLQIVSTRHDDVNNTTVTGAVTDLSMRLNTGRWYHIAVTFDHGLVMAYIDGKLKGSEDFSMIEGLNVTSVNFNVEHSDEMNNKPRCFWIGYSYDDNRPFNGSIAEVRIWNRALTADEINSENHFYKINMKDESAGKGLVAYWKLNGTLTDYSGYGSDLKSETSVVWKEVELPSADK